MFESEVWAFDSLYWNYKGCKCLYVYIHMEVSRLTSYHLLLLWYRCREDITGKNLRYPSNLVSIKMYYMIHSYNAPSRCIQIAVSHCDSVGFISLLVVLVLVVVVLPLQDMSYLLSVRVLKF